MPRNEQQPPSQEERQNYMGLFAGKLINSVLEKQCISFLIASIFSL